MATTVRTGLVHAVRERFGAANPGAAPMTADDDACVTAGYLTLEQLCARRGLAADELRAAMLARLLPLPSYLRSDGAEMVPADLLDLADDAGSIDRLPSWFVAAWRDEQDAADVLDSYLDGTWGVCLRVVTPETIRRKGQLVEGIRALLAQADPASTDWRTRLRRAVDELDALERPFTGYDTSRFGRPPTRVTLIDEPRRRYLGDAP